MEDYWSKEENKEKYAKKIKSYWADKEWRQKVIARRRSNEKVMESFYRNCHSKETFEKIAKANTKNHGKLISPDGQVIEVIGLRKFCEENGLNPTAAMSNISRILKNQGNLKSYKGWRKYEK